MDKRALNRYKVARVTLHGPNAYRREDSKYAIELFRTLGSTTNAEVLVDKVSVEPDDDTDGFVLLGDGEPLGLVREVVYVYTSR